jgi:Rrf2 family protein
MQLGEGVEWSIHACTILALIPPDSSLPAARLAEYHGVPPAYMAKHLQSLVQAGVLESVAGRKGGYRLAKPADAISVLDIVVAVEGDRPAFNCTEIRRRGPAAVPAREYKSPCHIHVVMDKAEAAWRAELAATSINDLLGELAISVSPVAVRKAAGWFQEVLR